MAKAQMGFTDQIIPELRVYAISLTEVMPHPDNARKHRYDLIMGSLRAHGQRSPIIVQKSSMFIVKGNGTWEAAKRLGWTRIAAIIEDMDDAHALAYLLADNKASDGAEYVTEALDKALQKLGGEGMDAFQSSLFAEDDLAAAVARIEGLVDLPDQATDAKHTHEFGDKAQEAQAGRESKAAEDRERLKDVRFALTLEDHKAFVDRLKALQKRFGTAGAIATIMEVVKRQSEAEGGSVLVTGRAADAASRAEAQREFAAGLRAVIDSLPGKSLPKATIYDTLDRMTPAIPEAVPAVVPGQTEITELLEPEPVAAEPEVMAMPGQGPEAPPERTDTELDGDNELGFGL